MVELLSVLPTWISLVMVGSMSLLVIRALRMLGIFRVLKLIPQVGETNLLCSTLVRARRKVLMYLVEGPANGFTLLPKSVYWAVAMMTKVGYGDITPKTVLGQLLTSLMMLVGYSIISVPPGIFTAELASGMLAHKKLTRCADCGVTYHDADARFCKSCGSALPPPAATSS